MDDQKFEFLFQISQALTLAESEPDTLKRIANILLRVLQAQQITVITFDTSKRTVTNLIQSSAGPSPIDISFDDWMQSLKELEGDEFQPSVRQLSLLPHQTTASAQTRLLISAPMVYHERTLGMIHALRAVDSPTFTKEERNLLLAVANQVAMWAENHRLAVIERQQRKQAETLREVARILNSSLDLQHVLEMILDQLERVIDYDSAMIMLYSGKNLTIAAYRKFRSPEQLSVVLKVDSLKHIQEVIERRVPVIIADVERDPRWQKLSHSNYIRCWMGVPLLGNNQVIGLLNLDKAQPGYYTPQDASLATVFANQAAIAIENARLYTAERERNEQLDAMRATIADISAELELPRLLRAILERSVALLNASGGDLGLYNEEQQEVLIVASHNMGKDYTGVRMKLGEGAMGMAVQLRTPVRIDNYRTWNNASAQYIDGKWGAVLAVPFQIGKRMTGVIGIVDARPDRLFSYSDQYLLQLFAQHCAIAVENARLYQEARLAAERRAILYQVSQEFVTASLDPESIYQSIHHATAQLMPAEAFIIAETDDEQDINRAVYLIDRSGRVASKSFPRDSGLSGRVLASGQSVYIADTLKESLDGKTVHFGDPEQVRSAIAAPMRLRGKVMGILSTQAYHPNAYTQEDLRLLEMLASHAAIALDNAKLLIHTQRLAITDPLTEIYNRRQLFDLGQHEFHRARRFGRQLSVIMIDLDHFKLVNDLHGHIAGDAVLQQVAKFLNTNTREIDILGRYGGEEFTIILPETGPEAAESTAERLRAGLEAYSAAHHQFAGITASIGVSCITADTPSFVELISQADAALYIAKNSGRNRVVLYSDYSTAGVSNPLSN